MIKITIKKKIREQNESAIHLHGACPDSKIPKEMIFKD